MIKTLIQMMNEDISARWKADSEPKPIDTTSSHTDAKPLVIRSVCDSQEHDRLVAWYGRCIHCKGTKMK